LRFRHLRFRYSAFALSAFGIGHSKLTPIMRTPFIAANWKMHKTVQDAVAFVREFRTLVKDVHDVEMVIAPPLTSLHAVVEAAHGSNVGVAAQNVHWEREGAFTGEVSAPMIKDAGAEYVLIGHSERRRLFGDTDEEVNRRLLASLGAQLTPIVCVGETLAERGGGQMLDVLDRQIKQGLDGVTADQIAEMVLAYEPVWAIGTGHNATAQQAAEAHAHIRGRLRQWFGGNAAEQCHIIYGGSVKPENIRELTSLAEVDGALVGGASLEVRSFVEIVTRCRG
jgi:triosephosphate isomerase (TIM)